MTDLNFIYVSVDYYYSVVCQLVGVEIDQYWATIGDSNLPLFNNNPELPTIILMPKIRIS